MTPSNALIEKLVNDREHDSAEEKQSMRKQLRLLVVMAQCEHLAGQLDMLQLRAIQEGSLPG